MTGKKGTTDAAIEQIQKIIGGLTPEKPRDKTQEIIEALKQQNSNVAEIAEFCQQNGNADLAAWMHAALQADPQAMELIEQVTECLKLIQRQIESLLNNPVHNEQALGLMLQFIHALADISPSFKNRIQDFYGAKLSDIKANRLKQLQLKQMVDFALQTDNLKQLHLDLINETRAALREVNLSLQEHVADLKGALKAKHTDPNQPQSVQTARDEFNYVTKSAIESADSNAPFDKLRKIGWMWATIAQYKYIAKFEAVHCSQADFVHQNPTSNRFLDNQKLKHRGVSGDVINTGGPTAPAPTMPGIKVL